MGQHDILPPRLRGHFALRLDSRPLPRRPQTSFPGDCGKCDSLCRNAPNRVATSDEVSYSRSIRSGHRNSFLGFDGGKLHQAGIDAFELLREFRAEMHEPRFLASHLRQVHTLGLGVGSVDDLSAEGDDLGSGDVRSDQVARASDLYGWEI